MTEAILFVDDEPNVLSGIRRTLRNQFKVTTAGSGKEALETLAASGPFAVIVSDMRMPEMNGVALLSRVKETAPDTVRLMLTGNSDQQTAIDAVNHGDIFRFLNKPCAADDLTRALNAALEQRRLIVAEKELLEQTLRGSVDALAQVLALVNPEVFGRTPRIAHYTREIALHLGEADGWRFETMAMLSQIGCVAVPADVLARATASGELSDEEAGQFECHPGVAADLIARIPRLEGVAAAIRYQHRRFDGGGWPEDGPSGTKIPLGARILRAVIDFEKLEAGGVGALDGIEELQARTGAYDPDVLDAFASIVGVESAKEVIEIAVLRLTEGMVLAADVMNSKGALVICKGHEVSASVLARMLNFVKNGTIGEKVRVWAPAGANAGVRSRAV